MATQGVPLENRSFFDFRRSWNSMCDEHAFGRIMRRFVFLRVTRCFVVFDISAALGNLPSYNGRLFRADCLAEILTVSFFVRPMACRFLYAMFDRAHESIVIPKRTYWRSLTGEIYIFVKKLLFYAIKSQL